MYQLLRVHLESVGHREARFDPLELDFRDEAGRALDTVGWLRNGGGKTTMLALLFSHLHPRRSDFLGGRRNQSRGGQPKALEDYVQPDDVAHVVAEWGRPAEGLFEGEYVQERLVTGQVVAWRRIAGKPELERVFYAFRPQPDILELDSLPFRRDPRHRTPLREFVAYLRQAGMAAPRLSLVVTENQRDWREYLESVYLDPEVFRYQLAMNDREGGAEEFLGFRDADSFVDFFLRLVIDAESVEAVEQNIGKVAERFAQQPYLQLELDLAEGIAERTPGLAQVREGLVAARTHYQTLRGDARQLLQRLTFSADRARQEQEQQKRRLEALRDEWKATESERETWQNRVQALDEAAARLRLEEAEQAHAAATVQAGKLQQMADAWGLAEQRLKERTTRSEVAQLRAELARAETDAADLRRAYEEAAALYRGRLDLQLAAAMAQVEAAEAASRESNRRAAAADAAARKAAADKARLETEQAHLRDRLDEARQQQELLVRGGVMSREESVAEAIARVERALADTDARLAELDAAQSRLDEEQVGLQGRQAQREQRRASGEARLRHLREQRAALARRLAGLAAEPEIQALTGGEAVDLLALASVLQEQLLGQAAEADRDLIALEVNTQETRRALAALQDTGLLPPSRDVESACQVLAKGQIRAVPGWRYLAENVRAEDRSRLVAQQPDLPAGVVVNDGDLEPAATLLIKEMVPVQPLTVSESGIWGRSLDPEDASAGRRVLSPSAAHYDAAAADEESDLCRRRSEEDDERRTRLVADRDRARWLAGELRRLREDSPPEGLASFDREVAEHERQLVALGAEADADRARLREIASERQRQKQESAAQEVHRRRLSGHQARLAAFAPQAAHVAEWEEAASGVVAELQVVQEQLLAAEATAASERAAAGDAQDRGRMASQECAVFRTLARDVVGGVGVVVEDDPTLATEYLGQAYRMARDRYEARTSRSETAQRLRVLEENLGQLSTAIGRYAREIVEGADALLDGPDGGTFVAREAALVRAREAASAAQQKVGACAHDVEKARQEVRTKSAEGKKDELPPELVPTSRAEAEAYLADARQRRDRARERRTDLERQQVEADERRREVEREAADLTYLTKHLAMALSGADEPVEDATAPETISIEEARTQVDVLLRALQEGKEDAEQAAAGLRERAKGLRTFVQQDRFAPLAGPLRETYFVDDDEGLAMAAAAQQGEMENRIVWLRKDLDDLQAHRTSVARELEHLVKEAFRTLDRAQTFKLPEGLGEWSGQPYLRISYPRSEPELIQGRLEAFVDELVRARTRPEGMALLFEAVRAAVGYHPFEATVLKPNEGLPRVRASVAEIVGKWSGGQRLTTALLLYCVLVWLRSVNRGGRLGSRASVLLLDNPFGRANHIDLVDLQLKVARALRVQLVTTTGLNDLEAIAAYPNVIRLRNLPDRRSGRSYVQVEAVAGDGSNGERSAGSVTAARVYRVADLPPQVTS